MTENSEGEKYKSIFNFISTPNNGRSANTDSDMEKMNTFLSEIQRVATDSNPYKRRDGQNNQQLPQTTTTTIQRIIQQRLKMLEFKTSGVALIARNSDNGRQQNSTRSQDKPNNNINTEVGRVELRTSNNASHLVKQLPNLHIKVGSVNTSGWTTDKAQMRVRQIVEHHHLDILILTETRKNLDEIILGYGREIIVGGAGNKTTGVQ